MEDGEHDPGFAATGWTQVDGRGLGGLNAASSSYSFFPVATVFNNELYAAWTEMINSEYQVRVKKYDGSSWPSADGGGAAGLNKADSITSAFPKLAVFDNTLYAAWHMAPQAYAR